MKNFFLLAILLGCHQIIAQNYSLLSLDNDSIEGINAIVKEDDTKVTLENYNSLLVERKKVVTILNEKASERIRFFIRYDSFKKIKDYEAIIYDALGVPQKKIKKKDFLDISATGQSLYTDDRLIVLNYIPTFYPYTIEFSYSYKTSNTAFLPEFTPLEYNSVFVENATFHFINESQTPLRKQIKNFEAYGISLEEEENGFRIEAKNLDPLRYEDLAPPVRELIPFARFSLEKFELQGVTAQVRNWQDFGKWQSEKLLKNLDELPEKTIQQVNNLVAQIDNPKEKVKAIYEYMQDRTRYISVQVGIGGWKPSPAEEVDALGYGDCKGLTNYTKALLKSQNIPSYYTIVDSQSSGTDLDEDFVAMQGDHVILAVPIEDEMIFLECTSQDLPFNFLGTHTDDRKVLMVTPEGAIMTHTPTYDAIENLRKTQAELHFNEQMQLLGEVVITSHNLAYYKIFSLAKEDEQKQKAFYKDLWNYHNGLIIKDIELSELKDQILFEERISMVSENYPSMAGEKILFCPNVFTRQTSFPQEDNKREYPFEVRRGYAYEDQVSIKLPDDYFIDSNYEPVLKETKFGLYEVDLIQQENMLIYTRKLVLKSGKWEKEEYPEYVKFMKYIAKKDKSKIIISKQF